MSWVSLFYSDVSSSVDFNGFVSLPFTLSRGVRQGCALFPLLYIFNGRKSWLVISGPILRFLGVAKTRVAGEG